MTNSPFSDLTSSKCVLNCFGSKRGAQRDSQAESDIDLKWQMTRNTKTYILKNLS